jgi:hypothetical protein
MQCLQHPFFQVGVRAPLAVRSPASSSLGSTLGQHGSALGAQGSALGATASGIKAQQLPTLAQSRIAPRRGSRDLFGQGKPLPGLAVAAPGIPRALGRQTSGASDRDAGLLPSLSLSGVGPRAARYKPGVAPADALKQRDRDSSASQVLDSLLPQVRNTSFGRASGLDQQSNRLEPRRGLGRRY